MRGFRDVREKTSVREKCPWPNYNYLGQVHESDNLPDRLDGSRESDCLPDRLGDIRESDSLPERLELPDDSGDLPYGCTFRMELPDDSGDLPCPKW